MIPGSNLPSCIGRVQACPRCHWWLYYPAAEQIELWRGENILLPPPQPESAGMKEPLHYLKSSRALVGQDGEEQ